MADVQPRSSPTGGSVDATESASHGQLMDMQTHAVSHAVKDLAQQALCCTLQNLTRAVLKAPARKAVPLPPWAGMQVPNTQLPRVQRDSTMSGAACKQHPVVKKITPRSQYPLESPRGVPACQRSRGANANRASNTSAAKLPTSAAPSCAAPSKAGEPGALSGRV